MATQGDIDVKIRAEVIYTQARIRVNEEGAQLVLRLLKEEESRVLEMRRGLVQAKVPTEGPNQLLARIRRVITEVERTIDEYWSAP